MPTFIEAGNSYINADHVRRIRRGELRDRPGSKYGPHYAVLELDDRTTATAASHFEDIHQQLQPVVPDGNSGIVVLLWNDGDSEGEFFMWRVKPIAWRITAHDPEPICPGDTGTPDSYALLMPDGRVEVPYIAGYDDVAAFVAEMEKDRAEARAKRLAEEAKPAAE